MIETTLLRPSILGVIFLTTLTTITSTTAFSAGKGFGTSPPSNNNAFVSFDRFRAVCPADTNAIRQFDPSLLKKGADDTNNNDNDDDVWVAVYRSANNLPSVFVRDAFFDAMKASTTTAQSGDSETLVSSQPSSESSGVIVSNNNNKSNNDEDNKPVAVARLGKDNNNNNVDNNNSDNIHILDSMRCILKKENTDDDCDGGSEHAEAIGVCIDELVLSYLQRHVENESSSSSGGGSEEGRRMTTSFDGGIHFRGTLVSGRLLEARGFREVSELSADMHSHESDYDGALNRYAERSASKEVAKNSGARDRALRIVSFLGRVDREEDKARRKQKRGDDDDDDGGGEWEEEESDFDPWASVKRYY